MVLGRIGFSGCVRTGCKSSLQISREAVSPGFRRQPFTVSSLHVGFCGYPGSFMQRHCRTKALEESP